MMRLLPRRPAARFALAAVALLGLGAAYVKHAQSKNPLAALPPVGAALPAFDFPLLDTGDHAARVPDRLSPASLLGNPAVLVIWSSNCRYSRQALPGLEQLRVEYEPQGVQVVIIAADADRDRMRRFADSANVRTPFALAAGREHLLADPGAWSKLTAQVSFPKFLVTDAEGRIVHRSVGVTLGDTTGLEHPFPGLRAALDSLARTSPHSPPA